MRVVIVGSGLAGVTVAESLARSPEHQVALITAETHGYYSRPRLSHGFSCTDEAAAKILMKHFDAMARAVQVLPGTQVEGIDREAQRVILSDGGHRDYEVLILATGSAARIPAPLDRYRSAFFTLNSYSDLLALRRRRAEYLAQREGARWAIIGGGLIGCEMASDLNKAGDAVAIFHREQRLIELQLSDEQSRLLHAHFADLGLDVRYSQDVRAVTSREGRTYVVTAEGEAGPFDGAIVAVGFAPRVELARQAELATARGILVNDYLRTSDPSVYAAGDVAEVHSRLFPFVSPIRAQALWLADHLEGKSDAPWTPPPFAPIVKIHGLKLTGLAPPASLAR